MDATNLLREEFAKRQIGSKAFMALYAEVMALVQRCSGYYDGRGKDDLASLEPAAARVFHSHWLYLTTGLMNASAAVLMLKAAIRDDVSLEAVADEIGDIRFLEGGNLQSRRECLPAIVVEMTEQLERVKQEIARYVRIVAPRPREFPDDPDGGSLPGFGPQAA